MAPLLTTCSVSLCLTYNLQLPEPRDRLSPEPLLDANRRQPVRRVARRLAKLEPPGGDNLIPERKFSKNESESVSSLLLFALKGALLL